MKSLIKHSWRFCRFAAFRGTPLAVLIVALTAGVLPAPISEVCEGGGTDATCTHGCCTGGAIMSCCPSSSPANRPDDKPAILTKATGESSVVMGGNCACNTTTQVTHLHERNPDSAASDTFAAVECLNVRAAGHVPLAQIPRAPPLV